MRKYFPLALSVLLCACASGSKRPDSRMTDDLPNESDLRKKPAPLTRIYIKDAESRGVNPNHMQVGETLTFVFESKTVGATNPIWTPSGDCLNIISLNMTTADAHPAVEVTAKDKGECAIEVIEPTLTGWKGFARVQVGD